MALVGPGKYYSLRQEITQVGDGCRLGEGPRRISNLSRGGVVALRIRRPLSAQVDHHGNLKTLDYNLYPTLICTR